MRLMGSNRVAQMHQFPGASQTSIVRAQEKVKVPLLCMTLFNYNIRFTACTSSLVDRSDRQDEEGCFGF